MIGRFAKQALFFLLFVLMMSILDPERSLTQIMILGGSVFLPIFLAGETVIAVARRYISVLREFSEGQFLVTVLLLFSSCFVVYISIYKIVVMSLGYY